MREWYGFRIERSRVKGDIEQFVRGLCPHPDRPDGQYGFGMNGSDARLPDVLARLKSAGLTPKRSGESGDYWLQINRDYTQNDLDQFQFLWATTGRAWPGGWRGEDGLIPLPRTDFPKKRLVNWAYHNNVLLVSSHFRNSLEREALSHLEFRPTQVWTDTDTVLADTKPSTFVPRVPPPRRLNWGEIGEDPWWEMTSDLVLPRVAPSMPLGNRQGDPRERTSGVWVYNNNPIWELTYRDEDLRQIEPFDAALTFERWFGSRDEHRYLIVSQRFRQAVLKHGLEMGFVPVHVEGRPEPINLDPPEKTPPRSTGLRSEDDE